MNLSWRSDDQVGRGYAPIGQTPEIHLSSQRVSVNYIASISNSREGTLHALHPEADSTSANRLHEPTDCQTNSQTDVDCRPVILCTVPTLCKSGSKNIETKLRCNFYRLIHRS
jgi:hypothetical protein